jgi:ubiquinone/menaquinone biosynthesis C-methylase UbiE
MGCAHFAAFNSQDYELLAQNIKKHKPDFVLFFSDAVDSPGEKPMLELGQDFYRGINKISGIPVFYFLNKRLLTDAFLPMSQSADLKENQYSFEYKNNLFIYPAPGDSIGGGEKSIAESQLNLLKNTIGGTSKYNNIFIFTRGYSWFDEEKEWPENMSFLVNNKVRYIFGPNLEYFDLKKTVSKYTMSKFMPCYLKKCPKFPLHHFLMVDVDKHSTSVKFISFAGSAPEDRKILSEEDAQAKFHIFRENERRGSLLNLERIVDTLKIKPGMDILDIGAGEGFFTILFAKRLKGKGRAFATEVQPSWIETIRKKVGQEGIKNVFPVLVQEEGVDPFYKRHSFDIIFLCESHSCLKHPEDYFKELKPSLRKDGRLYILNRENTLSTDDFFDSEFGDFKEVIQVLISGGEGSPIFLRLDKDVRDFIKKWRGEDVPFTIQAKITRDFNKIISDREFFKDYVDYYAREDMVVEKDCQQQPEQFGNFTSRFKQYKWFIIGLDSFGAFERRGKSSANLLEDPLRTFNKRLLTTIFDSAKQSTFLSAKNKAISLMDSAGYKLVRGYDFNKDYYFLEFKRKH